MTAPPPDPARTEQARQLARSLLADPSRSSASPDELAADHPELMPELGHELRKLSRIRQAFARASSSSGPLDAGSGAAAELPGEALPGYAIVGEIHRGGQGVVYRAIQNATRREVAIKVLREGPFAGRHDLQRFEQEVRILARLEHPDIVTIHDRGRSGRHDYFVMDYVPGTSLDEYVASGPDGQRRGVRETLTLWARVCEAVEAAHLRGVMHRDLKPGNVRVTPDGNPRVLDFGLAKQTSDDPDDDSAATMTRTGQFIGSLPWASPEQAEGRLDATDLRTDVYALGVVGYQLLTGEFPYRVQGPAHEVVQRICNETPPPVTRRRPQADDEVDTIVARCLAKEPQRRYQNAGELARDIRRYLAGDPIEAKRDSTTYVLRKLLIRHRAAVAAAALFFGVVLASTVMLTLQNQELRRSRTAEQTARATSDQVADFLQEAITAADPYEGAGGEPTVRDLLDQAAAQIHFTLSDDPAVRIPVQRTIGTSFLNLGQLDKAAEHLDAALADSRGHYPPNSPELVASLHARAELYRHTDQFEQAEELLDQALAILSDDPTDRPLRRASEILRAQIDYDRGDYPAARTRVAEILAALQDHPDPELLGEARNLAGLIALADEDLDEAAIEFELAYAAYQRARGSAHPATVTALGNIARTARMRGDYQEADRLYTQALVDLNQQLGPDHVVTLRVLQNHGLLLLNRGDFARARSIFEQIAARTHPGAAAARAAALSNLGLLHANSVTGNDDAAREARRQAIAYYEQAREALVALYGPDHPEVARADFNLGTAWIPFTEIDTAADYFASALAIRTNALPDNHPDLNATRLRLAQTRAFQNLPEQAVELAAAAVRGYTAAGDKDQAIKVCQTVARDLVRANHRTAAIPLLEQAITLLEARGDPESLALADQLRQTIEMLQ